MDLSMALLILEKIMRLKTRTLGLFLTLLPLIAAGQTFVWMGNHPIPDTICDPANDLELEVSRVSPSTMDGSYGLDSVCIDVTHVSTQELTIWLISPANTVILLSRGNGDGANFINTCFDGRGPDGSIITASSPATGSFLPEETLGQLNDGTESANGTWRLRICDSVPNDVGTVTRFSITFSNTPATPPPSNDECATPLSIPVSTNTSCMGTTSGTLLGASASSQDDQCAEAGGFGNDVWFSFQANANSQDIVVTNISGSTNELDFQLRSSCSDGSQLMCYFDPAPGSNAEFAVGGLMIGTTYLLRVSSFDAEPQNTTFDICIKKRSGSPANDECAQATTVTVNNDATCTQVQSGTLANASPSTPLPNCSFSDNHQFFNDVWFEFTPLASRQMIQIINILGSTSELIYEVSTGTCGNLQTIYCHEEPDNAFVLSGLDLASTYYLRVASESNDPQTTTFDVCVRQAPPAPSNDECTGAIAIPMSPPTCDNLLSGTLDGATQSPQPESCNFGWPMQNDVWFSFIATDVSHQIEISNVQNAPAFFLYQISSGSCSDLSQKQCFGIFNQSPLTADDLTIGEQYFLRIASLTSTYQATTFDVCIQGPAATPPANDECTNAVLLTVADFDNCDQQVGGTLFGATSSSVATGCSGGFGNFDDDVWFKFTAEQITHLVEVSNISGSTQDLSFELLDDCSSPNSLYCRRNSSGDFIKFQPGVLNIGSTYYIRVASFDAGIQSTTFDICVRDSVPDPPDNDDCSSATELTATDSETCNAVSGTMVGSGGTVGLPNCGGSHNADVWYQFEAVAASHVINVSSITGGTLNGLQVFSGNCGSLSELACKDDFSDGDLQVDGLTTGLTYYIRVLQQFPTSVSFDICVKGAPPSCTLTVTTTASSGPGSLREAVGCSSAGDTIRFDAAVHNSTITLATPQIDIPHPLVILANLSDNITLGNSDMNNTDVLISIQNPLVIKGLSINGLTAESLILKIEPGGSLELVASEMVKGTIDN